MHSSVRKDYVWNTAGVFLQNLISPVLLIVVTRLNGVDDTGLFSFALSIALIFWAFSIWGARTYQVSDVKLEFTHQSYVFVRLLLSVVVFVGALLFCLVNSYDAFKTGVILILVIYKTLESVADAVYGILQVNGRLYIAGRSLLYKSLLGMILFLTIDYFTHNILISSLGLIMGNLLILLTYDIPKAQKFSNGWLATINTQHIYNQALEIIKRCAPIASVIFMSMFSLFIPRYFIDVHHQEEIGYFGILAMPITALSLLITFIMQPNIVHLARLFFKQQYSEYKKTVVKIMATTGGISLLILPFVYFIGIDVFQYVFSVDFSEYKMILFIFVLGAIMNAFVTIFINLLTIMRHFKIQFYTLVVTNILLIIACIVLVPMFSFLGAVILYLIVNAVQLIFLVGAYYKALGDDK